MRKLDGLMSGLKGMRLAVAGSGVIGLFLALRAAEAGARVEVFDPGPLGQNASGVAAGMIAPVGECLFGHATESSWRLFSAARGLWSSLQPMAPGLVMVRSGARYRFTEAERLDIALERLGQWGGLKGVSRVGERTLQCVGEGRVDPLGAMQALQRAVTAAGGIFRGLSLNPKDAAGYDQLVVCAGIGARAFAGLGPELARLTPVKGHIVRFPDVTEAGPLFRTEELYLAPQPQGLLAGATMEEGVEDPAVAATAVEMLRSRAVRHRPELAGLRVVGAAGVRAATPDGLPMVGPLSGESGLAGVGLLRNGWLLAPLVAQILMSYLLGAERGPFDAALDPRRLLVSDAI